MTILCFFLTLVIASSYELDAGHIHITVDNVTGAYNLAIEGNQWFSSGDYWMVANGERFSQRNGTLKLIKSITGSGTDTIGTYQMVSFQWQAGTSNNVLWNTTFRAYSTRSALVFSQAWITGIDKVNGISGSSTSSGFPYIYRNGAPVLGFLEYCGNSAQFMVHSGKNWPSGIQGGGDAGFMVISPLSTSLSDRVNQTLVLGPLSQFMVAQHGYETCVTNQACLSSGPGTTFTSIPSGYVMDFLLTAVSKTDTLTQQQQAWGIPLGGTNHALKQWGEIALNRYNKQRSLGNVNKIESHLGYSTTGFYFYNPCDGTNLPNCSNYEDTLLAVDKDLKSKNVPYQYILIDSWWYKEQSYNDSVWMWEDTPTLLSDIFPHGLKSLQNQTGKIFAAHIGEWDSTSPYIKEYPFDKTMPQGPALWEYLFPANQQWKLTLVKQDHVNGQLSHVSDSSTNISVAESWLNGQSQVATSTGMTLLYCMSTPAVLMHSLTVPNSISTRASPDYVPAVRDNEVLPTLQWAIGPDDAFHWLALGLLPDKDTFFSNHSETALNPSSSFYKFYEPNPSTHALMAILSYAAVAPSDAVGATNVTLIHQLCRMDGLLLKPDRPTTAIELEFQAMMQGAWPGSSSLDTPHTTTGAFDGDALPGPDGEVYSTTTTIITKEGTSLIWTFLTAIQLTRSLVITPVDLGLDKISPLYTWPLDYLNPTPKVNPVSFSASTPISLSSRSTRDYGFVQYYIIAPSLFISNDPFILLGEAAKLVPISSQRISSLSTANNNPIISLSGMSGEVVEMIFFNGTSKALHTISCTIGSNGMAQMNVASSSCA